MAIMTEEEVKLFSETRDIEDLHKKFNIMMQEMQDLPDLLLQIHSYIEHSDDDRKYYLAFEMLNELPFEQARCVMELLAPYQRRKLLESNGQYVTEK